MMGIAIGFEDLIVLVLIGVVFLRLFMVLGRRTGHEPPPSDSFGIAKGSEHSEDNVITLPDRAPQPTEPEETALDASIWADDSPVGAGLAQIKIADHQFDPGPFVDGARAAYEMIVTAFALGDHQTLRNLLSDEVYDNFASAIEAREAASETLETTITTMKAADIVDAGLDGKIAEVTVKFVSDMISVSRDDDGEVIGGTSAEHEVTDIWTFGRDTGSRDPNWTLVATSSEN
jgi:predicted lipid-binding transport protein (Tim44 family)